MAKFGAFLGTVAATIAIASGLKALQASVNIITNYSIRRIYLSNSFELVIDLNIEIINPSQGFVTVNSVAGEIFYKNERLGYFSKLDSFKIDPRTKQTIEIPIIITLGGATGAVLSIIKSGTREIKINSKVYTSAGNIPFSQNITF